jgi:hypothetical protein
MPASNCHGVMSVPGDISRAAVSFTHYFIFAFGSKNRVRHTLKLRDARWFIFNPKNPNFGNFWSALYRKMLKYFMVICNILRTFGIFYDQLVNFVFLFPVLVLCDNKNLATLQAAWFTLYFGLKQLGNGLSHYISKIGFCH